MRPITYPIVLKSGDEYVPLAVAGGAGGASIIKQYYKICERVLSEMAVKEWHDSTPSYDQFEDAVGQIESRLIGRFRALRDNGIMPDFSMITASVDRDGRASIYLFDERGWLSQPTRTRLRGDR